MQLVLEIGEALTQILLLAGAIFTCILTPKLPYPDICSTLKWIGFAVDPMSSDGAERERATVMTYVPAYQKDLWREHAEELGMSQSEFVRTMVQAGRRDFEIPELSGDENAAEAEDRSVEADRETASTGDFERRVKGALSASDHRSWDELLAELTDDIEDRLDETLQELQAANDVQYSGRHGGYTLAEDPDEQ